MPWSTRSTSQATNEYPPPPPLNAPPRYFMVFQQLRSGLGRTSEAQAHGSILMVGAILDHGGRFMLPRFNEICVSVMELKDHPSSS